MVAFWEMQGSGSSRKYNSIKFSYGGREYGVGDVFEVWFHRHRGDFIARSDEGIVLIPQAGTRMIPEMMLEGWKIVQAKVKVIRIKKTERGTYCVILRPIEWRGLFK